MDVEINLLAVALAIVSSFVVGMIWYTPSVFGETWRKLIKMDKATMQNGPEMSAWVRTVVGAGLQAYILAHVTYLSYQFFGNSWMSSALSTALWMWLGFQLSMLLTHDAFEQRSIKLTMLNAGNQLATLLAMALAIGFLKP